MEREKGKAQEKQKQQFDIFAGLEKVNIL